MDKALALADEASRLPRWYTPIIGKHLYGSPSLTSSSAGSISVALCQRALFREKNKSFNGFLADVATVRRLARRGGAYSILDRLSSYALETRALQTLGVAVGSGTLTPDQCAAITNALSEFPDLPPLWEIYNEERRWGALEEAEHIALDDPSLIADFFTTWNDKKDPAATQYTTLDHAAVDWNFILKHVNAAFDRDIAALKIADAAQQSQAFENLDTPRAAVASLYEGKRSASLAKNPGESREAYSLRIADWVIAITHGSAAPIAKMEIRIPMLRNMLSLLLKAALEKNRTGHWPEKLEPLAAPAPLPLDIFSPEQKDSVLYTHTADTAALYSVGQNALDDGGLRDPLMHADDIPMGIIPQQ